MDFAVTVTTLNVLPLLCAVLREQFISLQVHIQCCLELSMVEAMPQSHCVESSYGSRWLLSRTVRTYLWSVQHLAPRISRVMCTPCKSLCLMVTKSIKCHWFVLASKWSYVVLVMQRMCSVHLLRRSRSLLFNLTSSVVAVFPNSGIKVIQDHHLVTGRSGPYQLVKVLVELFFGFVCAGKGGGVGTYDGSMAFFVQ